MEAAGRKLSKDSRYFSGSLHIERILKDFPSQVAIVLSKELIKFALAYGTYCSLA
jgi:hypothetical protein